MVRLTFAEAVVFVACCEYAACFRCLKSIDQRSRNAHPGRLRRILRLSRSLFCARQPDPVGYQFTGWEAQ